MICTRRGRKSSSQAPCTATWWRRDVLVRITGVVEGDLIAAAESIVVEGTISDDARIAGAVLTFAKGARVGGDVIAAGASLETVAQSNIDGGITLFAEQALLAGDVGDTVRCAVRKCRLSGQFSDDVELKVGPRDEAADAWSDWMRSFSSPDVDLPNVPVGLTIDDSAKIDGSLDYHSPEQAEIAPGAQVAGKVEWEKPAPQEIQEPTTVEIVLSHLRYFAGLLIVGVLMLVITPGWSRRLTQNVHHRPIVSFLCGLLSIVLIPIVLAVVLAATVALIVLFGVMTLDDLIPFVLVLGGTLFVTLSGGVLLYTLYLGNVVVGIAVGRAILGLIFRSQAEARFLPLAFGLALLVALMAIPYAGGIIALLSCVIALGGLFLWKFSREPVPHAPTA